MSSGVTPNLIDNGGGGGSSATNAEEALGSAINAASSFNNFASQVEAIAQQLQAMQNEAINRITSERVSTLARIFLERNHAINAIQIEKARALLAIHAAGGSQTADSPRITRPPQSSPPPGGTGWTE